MIGPYCPAAIFQTEKQFKKEWQNNDSALYCSVKVAMPSGDVMILNPEAHKYHPYDAFKFMLHDMAGNGNVALHPTVVNGRYLSLLLWTVKDIQKGEIFCCNWTNDPLFFEKYCTLKLE